MLFKEVLALKKREPLVCVIPEIAEEKNLSNSAYVINGDYAKQQNRAILSLYKFLLNGP
jgi:hypothetical protein